jgi:hypothetical protein
MDKADSASSPLKTQNPNLFEYHNLKNDMLTGDLLQWKKHAFSRRVYRWLIGSQVDHSSLIIRFKEYENTVSEIDTYEKNSKPVRRDIYNMEETWIKGAHLDQLSHLLEGYDGEVWLYRLKDDWRPEERRKIGIALLEHVGTPFDAWSVLKNFIFNACRRFITNIRFRHDWRVEERKLFCSEYCYLAYKSARGDLIVNKDLEIVFRGPPHPMDLPKLGIFMEPIKLYPAK